MELSRREFILKHAKFLFFLGIGSMFAPVYYKNVFAQTEKTNIFRPPGALNRQDFLNKCIRCFKCGEVCPFGTIEFLGLEDSFLDADTPYLANLHQNPCYLCMRCNEVCPTGALQKIPYEPDKILESVKIGTAVISEKDCVIYNGKRRRCHRCLVNCPFRHKAIYIGDEGGPVIDPNYCVGCGICVQACPFAPTAIQVIGRAD